MYSMDTQKNIAIIGMMGSGKSTIGRLLAAQLARTFVDSDQAIEQKTGVTIATIFEVEGEAGFRQREQLIITELLTLPQLVLATGGGAITHQNTRSLLKNNAFVIYLKAEPHELWRRIQHSRHRPLLHTTNPLDTLQKLLKEREPYYEETAHLIISTKRQSVKKLVQHITERLNQPTLF